MSDRPRYFIAPDPDGGDVYVCRQTDDDPVPLLARRKVSPYLWDLLTELIEAANA